MWDTRILAELKGEAGEPAWNAAEAAARRGLGFEEGVGQKNPLLVGACLEELWKGGFRSGLLERLCGSILAFANQQDETGSMQESQNQGIDI
jgi:hypothetical protein